VADPIEMTFKRNRSAGGKKGGGSSRCEENSRSLAGVPQTTQGKGGGGVQVRGRKAPVGGGVKSLLFPKIALTAGVKKRRRKGSQE